MREEEQYIEQLPPGSKVKKAFQTAVEKGQGQIWTARIHRIQGMMLCLEEHSTCMAYLSAARTKALWELLYRLPDYREIALYYEEPDWKQDISLILEGCHDPGGHCFYGRKRYKGTRRNPVSGSLSVTSKKDVVYKELKEIKSLSGRIQNSGFLLEGSLLVKRALSSHLTVHGIYRIEEKEGNREVVRLAQERGIPVYGIGKGLFAGLTKSDPVPSIAAYAAAFEKPISSFCFERDTNLLIVDSISSPDNLGLILRTADASGVDGVVLLGNGVHYLNRNTVRGARGAIGRVPVYFVDKREEDTFFQKLREHGFWIVGMSARAQKEDFFHLSYPEKTAFIVGNESCGVRKEILRKCDEQVRIPMADGQSSLNIAISAALVLYELVKHNADRARAVQGKKGFVEE